MGHATTGRAVTYFEGQWHHGNPGIIGPKTHGFWLSSTVFDGARSIGGKAPDLDLHCARTLHSARLLGMAPTITAAEILDLAREGIAQFPADSALYICPMIFGTTGFIYPEPDDSRFVLSIYESPLPDQTGFSATLSPYRRPAPDTAPTEAKASCLYPNVSRAVKRAHDQGYDTAVMRDPLGHVAEFSYANLFYAHRGTVFTPIPNGTFLNGITRQRVIQLLRDDGVEVVEKTVTYDEVLNADEVFGSGNYYKVAPCTRLEQRDLPPGPIFARAQELYWAYADQAS